MSFLTDVKEFIKKTPYGKRYLARKRVNRIVERYLLSPEEVKQGETDPVRCEELVSRQMEKWPEHAAELNSRFQWIQESPLNRSPEHLESKKTTMLFYHFAYGFSLNEFLAYDLENKSPEQRAEYISDRDSVRYAYRLNDIQSVRLLMDKFKTYQLLSPYYRRDVIRISSEEDRAAFQSFLDKHPTFFKKVTTESCGRGIERFVSAEICDRDQLFSSFLEQGKIILEEAIEQSDTMSAINESSVNTVRCFTLKTNSGVVIPWCWCKLGRKGFYIDNAATGGIMAAIDVTSGNLVGEGHDEFGQTYAEHPDAHFTIDGFQLPEWDEMKRICCEAAELVPGARWIGWDTAHTKAGWAIVEGNSVSEVIGPQSTWGHGIRGEFERYISGIKQIY